MPLKKLKVNEMIGKPTDEELYNQFTQQDDNKPSDEISLKAIGELFDIKKIKTNSRIKFEQVGNFAKLYMYADTFGEPYTEKLVKYLLQLQVSVSGLGRKEVVQLVQQRDMMIQQGQPIIKQSKDVFR